MSLAVAADGSVAFTDGFEWAIVAVNGPLTSIDAGFSANGPLTYGRGGDGARYSGWPAFSGNAATSLVVREGSGTSMRWSFTSIPPIAILAGPDGATWVLTFAGMVRLNADGSTTLVPLAPAPGGFASPIDVVLGADGAFWITEFEGAVERVPVQGAPVRYAVGGKPGRAALGPDGAVWFLDPDGLVRRITTSGAVTIMTATSGFALGDALAAGRDGAVWATHASTNELLRITPDGITSRYPATANGAIKPTGIAAAPDGSLYFVEETAGGLLLVHATPH